MKQRLAYKYRFYPTPDQAELLAKTFGCSRFVYNYMLNIRTNGWYNRERIGYLTTSKALTKIKAMPEYSWLKDVSSVPLQQSLRHLQSAFERFFAKQAKYPTFKKKTGKQSAEFTRSAFRFYPKTKSLTLAKMLKPLNIRWSRKLPFNPLTVTISKDFSGRYFISFSGEVNIKPLPKNENAVGIDFGLKHFAVTSDNNFFQHPKFLKKAKPRLKILQQRLSRQTKQGKNWTKTKLQIAKLHARITDSRKDFLHKFTTQMIQQYGYIVTEDLAICNMVKNHCLAESISDSSWSEATRQLSYKSQWYGRTYTKINRFFPSSKRCSVCGYVLNHLDLSTREWICPNCQTVHNRDLNASKNILAVGHTATIYGQGIRLPKNFDSSKASSCVVTTH